MADHAKQSLDYITKSGNYVCRPRRRIFVEHEIYSPDGKITRKATRQDIEDIAENNNEAAASGNPAKLTFGHTLDDQYDKDGKLIRHFSEEEQPATRGFWLNYTTEEIKDGKDKGKLALYADEWIQRTVPDERGNPVDGPTYAATFPGRSAEYLRRKKLIDSVALLRRTPALDLGIDVLPYQAMHPDRVFYAATGKLACVEDSRGKVRYALDEEDMEPESPAAPADDRVPAQAPEGGEHDGWMDEHQKFAEEAIKRTHGMHHSHAHALMHHMHSMYGAQLGLPQDKMTPHAPAGAAPAGAAPAPHGPAGGPPAPHTAPHSQGSPGAPMKPEHERMQADQDALERQKYSQRLAALESELAQYRARSAEAEERAMYASFEGKLKQLYMEGRDSINVANEIAKCKSRKYSQQQLDWHIEELARIPVGDSIVTGGFIPIGDSPQPTSQSVEKYSDNPDAAYQRSVDVQRYQRQTGKSLAECERWWVETHLNGVAH